MDCRVKPGNDVCGRALRCQTFSGRLPCEVPGVPGLSEICECVQVQGAPTEGRISVTVARPLRSNFLPSRCRPVERKISAPIAIRRSGEVTTSRVDVSKRKSSIEGQTDRHC